MNKEEEKKARMMLIGINADRNLSLTQRLDSQVDVMNVFISSYKLNEKFDDITKQKNVNVAKVTGCFGSCFNICTSPCQFMFKSIKLTFLFMFLFLALTGTIYIGSFVLSRFR